MRENVRAWQSWHLVSDQWRVGMDVVGFDLPGAATYLGHLGLADADTLVKIRVISNVAFAEMRARREDRKAKKT